MLSVISTVLSRLNAFLDSEMEQILCFDTAIDAETFCNEKSAIFIVLPEEDQTKYFMVSLILQNLYREILTVADENGGRLKKSRGILCRRAGHLPAHPVPGADVFRLPLPRPDAGTHCAEHHRTAAEELRQGGLGDHRGQLPSQHLRLASPQPARRRWSCPRPWAAAR